FDGRNIVWRRSGSLEKENWRDCVRYRWSTTRHGEWNEQQQPSSCFESNDCCGPVAARNVARERTQWQTGHWCVHALGDGLFTFSIFALVLDVRETTPTFYSSVSRPNSWRKKCSTSA